MTDQPLTAQYRDWIAACIDEDGIAIPHALVIAADGGMTVMALAVPVEQAYPLMLDVWVKRPREMIFAFDRFAKDGQGTTLGDLMAGWHFTREAPHPFIVEYQHTPRIVKPVEQENAFWNAALMRELIGHLRAHLGIRSTGWSI